MAVGLLCHSLLVKLIRQSREELLWKCHAVILLVVIPQLSVFVKLFPSHVGAFCLSGCVYVGRQTATV